jgi:hypothetical protein
VGEIEVVIEMAGLAGRFLTIGLARRRELD